MAIPPLRKRQPVAQGLRRLLKSHYLADEFPDVVTAENFANFCAANFETLPTNESLLKRITQYAPYSAPRHLEARRPLALPHPASQLALSRIIASNRREITTAIGTSNLTLYNAKSDTHHDRFFVGIDFKARRQRQAEVLARYPYVLVADIANFFHTIYTHSLPWAVLGKQYVKDVRELSNKDSRKKALDDHWSNTNAR